MLARAYQANGQIKEAVALLEYVVIIREAVLKEDHPFRLASQHELAQVQDTAGQVNKAIELLEQVVLINSRVLVEDHPSRLISQLVYRATTWTKVYLFLKEGLFGKYYFGGTCKLLYVPLYAVSTELIELLFD